MSRDWTFKEGGEYSDLGGDSYFGVVGTGRAGDTQKHATLVRGSRRLGRLRTG